MPKKSDALLGPASRSGGEPPRGRGGKSRPRLAASPLVGPHLVPALVLSLSLPLCSAPAAALAAEPGCSSTEVTIVSAPAPAPKPTGPTNPGAFDVDVSGDASSGASGTPSSGGPARASGSGGVFAQTGVDAVGATLLLGGALAAVPCAVALAHSRRDAGEQAAPTVGRDEAGTPMRPDAEALFAAASCPEGFRGEAASSGSARAASAAPAPAARAPLTGGAHDPESNSESEKESDDD